MWSQRGIALLQLFEIPSVLVRAVVDDKDEHLTLKLLAINCWSVKSVIFLTLNEPTNHQQKFAKEIVEKKERAWFILNNCFPSEINKIHQTTQQLLRSILCITCLFITFFFQTIVNKNNLNISVQFYLLLVSGYVKKPMTMKFQLTRILIST